MLVEAVARAAVGRRSVVLVGGEAGIGKTRLVAAVAGRYEDLAVLAGSCLGYADGGLPLAPVLSALRSWAPAPDGAPTAPDGVPPPVGPPWAGESRAAADTLDRVWAYGTIAAAIDRIAAERPVVLVVDDVHWADRTTLEFLDYLVSRSDRQRLALIATYRDNEAQRPDLGRWLGEMIRGRGAVDLHLDPLAPADAAAVVRELLPDRIQPELAGELHRRSGGNPYLLELLAQTDGPGPGSMPAGLTQALLARWHELPDGAADLLTLLAVLGRPVLPDTLAAVVDRQGGDPARVDGAAVQAADRAIDRAIEEAIDEGIRCGVIAAHPDGTVGFRHPLIGEIVVGTLPPGRRRRYHRAIAAAFAELPGLPAALRASDLALHHAAAGNDAETLRWSVRSADHAVAAHGFAEAFAHLAVAVDRWDAVAEPERIAGTSQPEILLRAIHVGVMSGHTHDLLPLARKAMTAVDPVEEPVRAGGIRAHLFRMLSLAVQDPLVEQAARESFRLTEGSVGSERAHALGLQALFTGMAGRADEAIATADAAVSMARDAGDPAVLARCLVLRGSGRVLLGLPGAHADLVEGMAIARSAGELLELAGTHAWRAIEQSRAGDHDGAIDTLLAGWQDCRASGLDRGLAFHLLTYAVRLLRERGRWEEADGVLQELRAADPSGVTLLKVRLAEAQLLAARGRTEEAHRVLDAAGDLGRTPFLDFVAPDHHLAPVEVATWEGRPGDALAKSLTALDAISEQDCGGRLLAAGVRAAADIAVAARDRGDATGARRAERAVEQLSDARARLRIDPFDPAAPTGWEPSAYRATWEAEVARLEASADQIDRWLAAENLWRDRGFGPDAAYAGVRAGEALIAAGRVRDAAAPLRRAHGIAARIGAAPLAEAAASAARAAHIPLDEPVPVVDDAVPRPLDRLTRREREVLALIAAGRTNTEIGRDLFITATTASVHVSNILRKLQVPDRYAAAALANRLAGRPAAPPGQP